MIFKVLSLKQNYLKIAKINAKIKNHKNKKLKNTKKLIESTVEEKLYYVKNSKNKSEYYVLNTVIMEKH